MAQTHKHTILVVDDEPDILFSLQALLRRDFEVHTAESGARALEVLRQHPVHVIMTDQRMPEMTGVEATAPRLPARTPSTPAPGHGDPPKLRQSSTSILGLIDEFTVPVSSGREVSHFGRAT